MFTFVYQQSLRPELPTYFVPKEYREFRDTLVEVNRILESGIEHMFIVNKMETLGIDPSTGAAQRFYTRTSRALHYCFLLALGDYAHRELAVQVSDSLLLQWFTGTDGLVPRPYSKSTIERFEKSFDKDEIEIAKGHLSYIGLVGGALADDGRDRLVACRGLIRPKG